MFWYFIFIISGVTIQNNETGFEEKNIRALCDVGKSTKSKHQVGYIGNSFYIYDNGVNKIYIFADLTISVGIIKHLFILTELMKGKN